MPYVIRIKRSGKKEVDKYYTSRLGKKKARQEAGAGINTGGREETAAN